MSVEPSEESHSITWGRRLSLSLLCSDNHITFYMSGKRHVAAFESAVKVLVLLLEYFHFLLPIFHNIV